MHPITIKRKYLHNSSKQKVTIGKLDILKAFGSVETSLMVNLLQKVVSKSIACRWIEGDN